MSLFVARGVSAELQLSHGASLGPLEPNADNSRQSFQQRRTASEKQLRLSPWSRDSRRTAPGQLRVGVAMAGAWR
jgi:hypothetical protein